MATTDRGVSNDGIWSRSRGTLARGGLALSVIVLTAFSLFALSVTPSEAATSKPHASATCTQTAAFPFPSKVVGIAATPDDGGYWIVTSGGYVAACGDAPYLGEQTTLNAPIVGIAATPDGGGYYLVASDGGIFTFGDAVFQGSTGSIHLNKPVVGMTVDPATGGYWLVATDGGIFAYNAPFLGSTGSITLNKPVVGMAAASDGSGYWLVATDGGIFAYGVPFWGSTGSIHLNKPVVGMAADAGIEWLLARRLRWRDLCLQRSVLRIHWEHRLEPPDSGHGGHRNRQRVPLHRSRRRNICLRILAVLRHTGLRPTSSSTCANAKPDTGSRRRWGLVLHQPVELLTR